MPARRSSTLCAQRTIAASEAPRRVKSSSSDERPDGGSLRRAARRGRRPDRVAHRLIDYCVDIGPEPYGVDEGQLAELLNERLGSEPRTREGSQFGNGLSVAGDRHPLAAADALDHLPPAVA